MESTRRHAFGARRRWTLGTLFSMLSCGSAFVTVPTVETLHGVNSRALMVRTTLQASSPSTSSAGQGMSSARRKVPLTDEEYNHVARTVKVVSVIPGSAEWLSPLGVPWTEVMEHMARRMSFVDPKLQLRVVTAEQVLQDGAEACGIDASADIVYLLNLQTDAVANAILPSLASVPSVVSLNCTDALRTQTHIKFARPYGRLAGLWRRVPLVAAERRKLLTLFDTVVNFWERGHSDDLLFMMLVVINAAVTQIKSVSEVLKPVTLRAASCMVCNCRKQIVDCQKDPTCKAALACLENCAPNDQVCRYRCIVSYESPEFQEFALCILQKHNCLENHAVIPPRPDPGPMTHFRGQPLTHETAEEICFGGLCPERPWSWKVVCGQNAAYDTFPCQYQLFYRKGKQVWYDPVFKVFTMPDGKEKWRRRHYRVRRASLPGTFYFSVLDNGVTSNEYWRIVDAADDLSWVLFFYAGAAAAAGQAYSGSILVTPDGKWPEGYDDRLLQAFDRAGIRKWEFFRVNWDCKCEDNPPLILDDIFSKGSKPPALEAT